MIAQVVDRLTAVDLKDDSEPDSPTPAVRTVAPKKKRCVNEILN